MAAKKKGQSQLQAVKARLGVPEVGPDVFIDEVDETGAPIPCQLYAIDTFLPHPRNPKKGSIDKIRESIRTNGFYGSIIVQASTNYIIAGAHRWKSAKLEGYTCIPARRLDVDDEKAMRILLVDNRTSDLGTYDNSEIVSILQDLEKTTDLALVGTGFDPIDIDKLLTEMAMSCPPLPPPEPAPQLEVAREDMSKRISLRLSVRDHANLTRIAKSRGRKHTIETVIFDALEEAGLLEPEV